MTSEKILVGVSNRHIHLSRAHVDILFGPNHELKVYRALRQSGQFAAEEKVTIVGNVELSARVVGPLREQTQVEILQEDTIALGISAPTRISGQLENTPGIMLRGPHGEVSLDAGVIVAAKHVHMSIDEVPIFGLEDIKSVDIQTVDGKIFKKVPLRVGNKHLSEFHMDKDEAKNFNIESGQEIKIIKKYSE